MELDVKSGYHLSMDGLTEADLGDLGLLYKIIELNGFTAASKASGIPQATLSRRIAKLEARVGQKLLFRSTRSVRLTALGEKLNTHAARIVEELRAAQSLVDSRASEPEGRLRVTAPPLLGQTYLGELLARLVAKHPRLRFEVDISGRQVDLIEEGYDCAVRVGVLDNTRLIASKLLTVSGGFYVGASFADAFRKAAHPRDLQGKRWLLMTSPFETQQRLELEHRSSRRRFSIDVRAAIQTNDHQVVLSVVTKTPSVCFLPRFCGQPHVASGKLVPVLTAWKSADVDVFAVRPHFREGTPALRVFLQELKLLMQS